MVRPSDGGRRRSATRRARTPATRSSNAVDRCHDHALRCRDRVVDEDRPIRRQTDRRDAAELHRAGGRCVIHRCEQILRAARCRFASPLTSTRVVASTTQAAYSASLAPRARITQFAERSSGHAVTLAERLRIGQIGIDLGDEAFLGGVRPVHRPSAAATDGASRSGRAVTRSAPGFRCSSLRTVPRRAATIFTVAQRLGTVSVTPDEDGLARL